MIFTWGDVGAQFYVFLNIWDLSRLEAGKSTVNMEFGAFSILWLPAVSVLGWMPGFRAAKKLSLTECSAKPRLLHTQLFGLKP